MTQFIIEQMPNISASKLASLQNEAQNRRTRLRQRIAAFEKQYRCTLPELEQKLKTQAINEHPAWEDSIEWRNALEQLEQTKE